MNHPSFTLLYVDSPERSGRFYADLLGREPVETSPTFVLFVLDSGLKLGLWSRHTVTPPAGVSTGSSGELAIQVEHDATVDAVYAEWQTRGIRMLLEPTVLEFGRSFVALDPDGHRLRVYALAAEPR